MMIPEMCSRPRSVTTFDGWLIFRAHLNHQPLKRVNLNYLYKQISPNKIDNYVQDAVDELKNTILSWYRQRFFPPHRLLYGLWSSCMVYGAW